MGIPRPKTGWRWLVAQTATFDIATAGFTAILGLTAAANYWLQGRAPLATLVVLATGAVLTLTIVKNTVALAQARQKESVHELEGCLLTLHATLDPAAMETLGRLRLAIHVAAGSDTLEQATEYIGDAPRKGRVGRRFPATAGIIGKAFREGDAFVGQRINDDYEAYIEELITDWNYTKEWARRLNPAVKAWMAVPFYDTDKGQVDAVLYLDSTDSDFFTPERQELVLSAANGIAVFIGRRYTP